MSLASTARSQLRLCLSKERKFFRQTAAASTSAYQQDQTYTTRLPPQIVREEVLPSRIKPVPSSFYTTRPTYVDSLILLEDLARRTKRALQQAHIPLEAPEPAPGTSTNARLANAWLKADALSKRLGVPLKSSQYRHIVARLKALAKYRPMVEEHFLEGQRGRTNRSLGLCLQETLANFSRDQAISSRLQQDEFYSKSSYVDELGRTYARGRRKESSARVWIVPKRINPEEEGESLVAQSMLINLQTVSQAFSRVAHREQIVYPLRLAGVLGTVNVFALVRGGGVSGQAGAIAHGIARALVTFFDHQAKEAEAKGAADATDRRLKALAIRDLLAKDGVLVRDPRMVERKKTGLAKARKAYTWVKR